MISVPSILPMLMTVVQFSAILRTSRAYWPRLSSGMSMNSTRRATVWMISTGSGNSV